MPKLRKLRRKQKFQFNKNRKRVQKSEQATRKKNIKIQNDVMKENWDRSKAVKENLEAMGLAFDPNKVMKVPSVQAKLAQKIKGDTAASGSGRTVAAPPSQVVKKMQEQVASLTPAECTFRFNQEQVKFITYMMDRHGDDFKAMARDPKNEYQETPKQIRQKVRKFCSLPAHYVPYMRDRGMLKDDEEEDEITEQT